MTLRLKISQDQEFDRFNTSIYIFYQCFKLTLKGFGQRVLKLYSARAFGTVLILILK